MSLLKKKTFFKLVIAFAVLFFIPFSVFADETESRVRVYRATSYQVVATSTWTKVKFNAESYDNLEEFDSTTNYRFTAKKTGYYLICSSIIWTNATDQSLNMIQIRKNGSSVSQFTLRPSGIADFSISAKDILYLVAGDYLELWVYHERGVNNELASYDWATFMAINKLFSMPDIYTQITNASNDAEFYLEKTINYGDLLLIIILSIFLIFGIISFLWKFISPNFWRK